MPKPSEIATELRKLADSLDACDDTLPFPHAFVVFNHKVRETFLALARTMPRPFEKKDTGGQFPEIRLTYRSAAMSLWSEVPKSLTCTLVEPAKPAVYKCDPILSEEEDAVLNG